MCLYGTTVFLLSLFIVLSLLPLLLALLVTAVSIVAYVALATLWQVLCFFVVTVAVK